MWIKILRVTVTVLFLSLLCACATRPEALPPSDETPEHTSTAVSPQTVSSVDVTYLLSCIAQSGERFECFPALIKSVQIDSSGCVLHIDRLETNPDFRPGAPGDEIYLLNETEVVEDIKTASLAYAEYDAKTVEISPDFSRYISGFEDGAQFTVFKLGDEVIFLSEITVP